MDYTFHSPHEPIQALAASLESKSISHPIHYTSSYTSAIQPRIGADSDQGHTLAVDHIYNPTPFANEQHHIDWNIINKREVEFGGRMYFLNRVSSKLIFNIGFQVISSPSRFFKVGRVFKSLWIEPAGNMSDQNAPFMTRTALGETAFTKVRHFVVVREMHGCCLCLPLNTYNGKGTLKEANRPNNHAAVFPLGGEPKVLGGERLSKEPFPINVEEPTEKIDPLSRLNFGRIYTVEHNIKVRKVGRIPDEHLPRLNEYFEETFAFSKQGRPSHTRSDRLSSPSNCTPNSNCSNVSSYSPAQLVESSSIYDLPVDRKAIEGHSTPQTMIHISNAEEPFETLDKSMYSSSRGLVLHFNMPFRI